MSGNAALVFDVCHARLEFVEGRKELGADQIR